MKFDDMEKSSCDVHYLPVVNFRQEEKLTNSRLLYQEATYDNVSMRNLENFFNKRIRQILKEKGMSQRELAERADIDQSYLSVLLNMNKRWNLEYVEKVIEGLGIPAWQLFADPADVIPEELYELSRRYKNLSGDDKRIVDAIFTTSGNNHTPKKSASNGE